jgi:hypothetical protein
MELIEGQKRNLKRAKSRQGQVPRGRKPKEQQYLHFMMALMAKKTHIPSGQQHTVHSSFIPPAYLPCTTPLAQLSPTTIRHLRLETQHRDTYLLLRAITPPNRFTGICVLAEDEYEDATMLQLYQQEEEDIRKATDIVEAGTVLLIKEPYFKLMASGEYGLRVDHLSDVVPLGQNDPILPKAWFSRVCEAEDSAEISKSKGDSAVRECKYWKAIEEYIYPFVTAKKTTNMFDRYTKAISQNAPPDRIEVIKRNRALAYLKTKHYNSALSDTGFPIFGLIAAEKALFRAIEALYFLQRFVECADVLEMLCSTFPSNKQSSALYERVRRRCLEASSGEYDFRLLQQEAKTLRPPHLDHATYIGPIEIRNTADKGRGLVVTEAAKAGELLLCEKAFTHAYAPEASNSNSRVTLLIKPETRRGFIGGQADLITLIIQKLYRNPSVAKAFTDLHYGTYKPTNTLAVDGKPIVDT